MCTVSITWIKTSIFHSVVIIKILITGKKVVIDLRLSFSANIPLKSFKYSTFLSLLMHFNTRRVRKKVSGDSVHSVNN